MGEMAVEEQGPVSETDGEVRERRSESSGRHLRFDSKMRISGVDQGVAKTDDGHGPGGVVLRAGP